MNWLGCEMTEPGYTKIEECLMLFDEPERFFNAVVTALDLCE
jgi:hypothetical protein